MLVLDAGRFTVLATLQRPCASWVRGAFRRSAVPEANSSTVQRRRLGIELRRLREAAGLSATQVADCLDDVSQTKVSRLERGRVRPRVNDVKAMLELYGVQGAAALALIDMARESKGGDGWWVNYSDVLPEWFQAYVGLEAEAARKWTFESQLIPGLLQTEDYARALIRAEIGLSAEEVERRAKARVARQRLLRKEQALQIWAIIDESALRRPVGGPVVMREQLDHLLSVSELPNVMIQVLPFSVGAHPAVNGAFAILGFTEQTDPDIVYLDTQTAGIYLDKPVELERYKLMFDHLRARAADPDTSTGLIAEVARSYSLPG
ncbi:XRE family transcriptional regulator [Pseudonocardiaceae bacterium YIM PH 21723]|nr:XRE family transcriptional regulator [Pseudonocardiaceae bacterium YIM PH 21723]